jgi:hypothetical protein
LRIDGDIQEFLHFHAKSVVFHEAAFADHAADMASWPQTTFLHHAQSTRMVFIGHSMADPNVRKWLSWSMSNEVSHSASGNRFKGASCPHLWLTVPPKSNAAQEMLSKSLFHLGVRPVFLKDYREVGRALTLLLGLPEGR